MAVSTSIFRACVALSLVAVAAPCASQSNGTLTQAAIQGAFNAILGNLGGKPAGAAANGITPGTPSESSFKDILATSSGSQWPRVAVTIIALQPKAYDSTIMTQGWNQPYQGTSWTSQHFNRKTRICLLPFFANGSPRSV